MRILLFTTSLEKSAVSTQLLAFASYLHRHNHQVVLACHEHLSYEAKQSYEKLPYSVRSLECKRNQILKGVLVFRKLQKEYNVDIVHCHLGRAYVIGILGIERKRILLATFHNLKNYLAPLTRYFVNIFYARFNGITVVSQRALESYCFNDTANQMRRTIYNPVFLQDMKKENNKPVCKPSLFNGDFFVVGTINRFVHGKGYDTWVRLIKQLFLQGSIQCKRKKLLPAFWAAGHGVLEQSIKQQVQEEKIARVKFLGYRSDVFSLIQQSHVIVYPTVNEGFGLVLYETLLAGIPVLVNPLPVFKELLGNESIWFVDFANIIEVQEKIQYFSQEYTFVKQQAKKDGNRFRTMLDPNEIFNQYISFYRDCSNR